MISIFRILCFAIIVSLLGSCKNRPTQKAIENFGLDKISKNQTINTSFEIKVYNDFIDQVYRIYYCHLAMDTPEEYEKYHENNSKKDLDDYTKEFNVWFKKFNRMLDTSKITAYVNDSLKKLEFNVKYLRSELDSTETILFKDLLNDTIPLPSALYNLDSLKSNRIFFEISPYSKLNLNSMSEDSAYKYWEQAMKYWQAHVGHQVGNRYYIGEISMSRVKFNVDSTLCLLECGYLAQTRCGYGDYYFLKKSKNKFIVIKKVGAWVS
jgi:hypothetical protein